ncbi:MAG: NUDIX domain-containing protein [Bacteroidales bacterium]|nr:NUDIX domain-containing protein [Bacteroidales bacterium]
MYKVYFSNRSVEIVPAGSVAGYDDGRVYYKYQQGDDLSQLPFWFEKAVDIEALVIEADSPGTAFDEFISTLKREVAAGGVICNIKGQTLLFWRRGAWDMPKGHQEPGETLEECALREVQEETGLTHIALGDTVCVTYHTHHRSGNFVLKESHWYRMTLTEPEKVKVQTEEDIERATWCGPGRLPRLLRHAYPSIRDVFASL